jgi:hypothetical protein
MTMGDPDMAPRAYLRGEAAMTRLNAVLNALSDS